jgi:uncharacterized protein YajQ (UPF0234 family)
MPSFDVVSEVDSHELTNSVDQTNREVTNRFDFKGTNSKVEQNSNVLTVIATSDFQVKQVIEILRGKMSKRGIDVSCLDYGTIHEALNEVKQEVTVREGLDKELAKKIVKIIKDEKLKVQASIQGDQVRVTGKKRDDLQSVIALLKEKDVGLPLQYTNFRDSSAKISSLPAYPCGGF